MAAIQIIGINTFLSKLTGNKLTENQLNRASAYLRAKKIVFYDNWSQEHCTILDDLNKNKTIVIESLKKSLYEKSR